MKIIKLHVDGSNTGKVKPVKSKSQNEAIEISKGRYVENETSQPLYDEDTKYFKRIYCLEYKRYYIYWFYHFGKAEGQGTHVGFTWLQHSDSHGCKNDTGCKKKATFATWLI